MTHGFPNLVTALQVRPMTVCTTRGLEMLPVDTEQNQQVLQFPLKLSPAFP